MSPTEATILAKELILGGLRHLEDHGNFKKIIVVCNYGNHGRTTKMRRQSTGYKNSYEWMMFKEIQIPFINNRPEKRKNFLSYSYVLHKFVELLELDQYKSCFPLLKSRQKLHGQDIIWKKICHILTHLLTLSTTIYKIDAKIMQLYW